MSLKNIIANMKQNQLIITPQVTRWLLQNNNLVLDKAVADIIYEQITKQPRDRSASFSSSAAGSCLRRQIYAFCGVNPGGVIDPVLQQLFFDGTWRHLRWQALLLTAEIIERIEIPLDWPAKRSMGSMDGAGVVPVDHPYFPWRGVEFGLEIKGMNSWQFKNLEAPLDHHLDQAHRYALSGGFDLFVFIYENKDTQAWKEYVVEIDPDRLAKQEKELELLNEAVDLKVLPSMLTGCEKHLSTEWKQCPFGGAGGPCDQLRDWTDINDHLNNQGA